VIGDPSVAEQTRELRIPIWINALWLFPLLMGLYAQEVHHDPTPSEWFAMSALSVAFTCVSLMLLYGARRFFRSGFSRAHWREALVVLGAALLTFGFAGDEDTRPLVMAIGAALITAGGLALRRH